MQQCSVRHGTGSWRMTIFCLSFRAKPRNQRGAIQERTHDTAKISLKRECDREIRQALGRKQGYSNRASRSDAGVAATASPSRAKRAQGKLRFLGFARNGTTNKCTEQNQQSSLQSRSST